MLAFFRKEQMVALKPDDKGVDKLIETIDELHK
jgi:hypothetical protein